MSTMWSGLSSDASSEDRLFTLGQARLPIWGCTITALQSSQSHILWRHLLSSAHRR